MEFFWRILKKMHTKRHFLKNTKFYSQKEKLSLCEKTATGVSHNRSHQAKKILAHKPTRVFLEGYAPLSPRNLRKNGVATEGRNFATEGRKRMVCGRRSQREAASSN